MGQRKPGLRGPLEVPLTWFAGATVPQDATYVHSRQWWDGKVVHHEAA